MIKKQLIMDNALQLFAEQGFEATSIQQITDKCGISKGAFYLSFKSKDALILALINHFLSEIIADIERLVNSDQPASQLLYNYFNHSLQSFKTHAYFAQLFLQEQKTNVHSEVFKQVESYTLVLNSLVKKIIQRQFPQLEEHMLVDIVFTVQSFIRGYGELFLRNCYNVDIDLICRSAIEKVTIIAKHGQTPCIPIEWLHFSSTHTVKLSKDQLISFLQEIQHELPNEITQQSVELLRAHLQQPSLPAAVEQGLLNNLSEHSHSKWIAYIYKISDKS